MTVKHRPTIVITMGDAAGIGPEIIVKALLSKQIYSSCCPVVVGDGITMSGAIKLLDSPLKLQPVNEPGEVKGEFGSIDLIDLKNLDQSEIIVGHICGPCGKAAMEYISQAAQLAIAGKVKVVVTTPINKEATIQAGYGDVGHLEFFARITQASEYATMLVSGSLRVVHLTTHHSLKDACELVTKERIFAKLRLTHDSFGQWGIAHPRIGVAALNPHAGEGGSFGSEEIEQILPALEEAQGLGIDARGPFPADSIFNRAIGEEFDVVLAMYHDQGHIPIKVHGFERSVSVALGLPFIRTSVDHGTAFDIAGKGIADSQSLEEAIKMAVQLCEGRGLIR
ncbi:4-hydroxythreonine-4-phosphate dehydrogenase PdxA [Chloroflexota bacterium]